MTNWDAQERGIEVTPSDSIPERAGDVNANVGLVANHTTVHASYLSIDILMKCDFVCVYIYLCIYTCAYRHC